MPKTIGWTSSIHPPCMNVPLRQVIFFEMNFKKNLIPHIRLKPLVVSGAAQRFYGGNNDSPEAIPCLMLKSSVL